MNNRFTKGCMAHLTPYPKKKNMKGFQEQIEIPKVKYDVQELQRRIAEEQAYIQKIRQRIRNQNAEFRQNIIFGEPGLIIKRQAGIEYVDPISYNNCSTRSCSEISIDKAEEKVEPRIKKIYNPKGYKHDRGFVGNHQHVQYQYESGERFGDTGNLSISDSIGGCGMQQLYDWTNISTQNIADKFVAEMLGDLHRDTGLIICQVGQTYYDHVLPKALEKVGFTYPIEYKNFTHDAYGKYSQRVYTYQVPDKVPENIGEPKPWQY